jgi:hypothetical protein
VGSSQGNARREHDPQLTRHLPTALDVLETESEWVQATVLSPGWQVLLGLLEREIETINRELDGRLLESRSHYAAKHGRLGGLRAVAQFAEALIDKADAKLAEQRAKHEQPVGAGEREG